MLAATSCCAASAKATPGPISVRQAVEKLEQQANKVKDKWAERKRSDARRRVARAGRRRRTGRGGLAPR